MTNPRTPEEVLIDALGRDYTGRELSRSSRRDIVLFLLDDLDREGYRITRVESEQS